MMQWPITDIPNLGNGFLHNIGQIGGVPIVAIVLKLITFGFQSQYQYFGAYMLIAFIVQTQIALNLLSRFIADRQFRSIGALFFLISPLFLHRLNFGSIIHIGFAGSFLVIWMIDTYFNETTSRKKWLLIVLIAVSIDVYVTAMILVVFIAWLANNFFDIEKSKRCIEIKKDISVLVLTALGIFLVLIMTGGLFQGSVTRSFGWQYFKADLLSLVLPTTWWSLLPIEPIGWSLLYKGPHLRYGSEEGFGFIGISVIAGSAFVFISRLIKNNSNINLMTIKNRKKNRVLFLSTLLLYVYGTAGVFDFGGIRLASFKTPAVFENFVQVFRASGRFVWPLGYAITLYFVVKLFELCKNYKIKGARTLLTILVLLQVVDQSTAFLRIREIYTKPKMVREQIAPKTMKTEFWQRPVDGCEKVLSVLPFSLSPVWEDGLGFAAHNHLDTNMFAPGRTGSDSQNEDSRKLFQAVINRFFEPKTIYLVPLDPRSQESAKATVGDTLFAELLLKLKSEHWLMDDHDILIVDDILIIAPNIIPEEGISCRG
jgi:hypothetical protein